MNCGFSDRRYLEDACQKAFGCSVAEYRKRAQAQSDYNAAAGAKDLHWKCSQPEAVQILKKHVSPDLAKELE